MWIFDWLWELHTKKGNTIKNVQALSQISYIRYSSFGIVMARWSITMPLISLTLKEGMASNILGIMCQQFGTILPCICNSPYPPSTALILSSCPQLPQCPPFLGPHPLPELHSHHPHLHYLRHWSLVPFKCLMHFVPRSSFIPFPQVIGPWA